MVSIIVPTVTAVLVAWLGFRYALSQDVRRWAREQRAALYVDLLVEVSAERDFTEHRIAEIESGMELPAVGTDDRLQSAERRRLGARADAFASREVVRRWNVFQAVGFRAYVGQEFGPVARVHLGSAADDVVSQVRHELESERLPFWRTWRRPALAPDDFARMQEQEAGWRR